MGPSTYKAYVLPLYYDPYGWWVATADDWFNGHPQLWNTLLEQVQLPLTLSLFRWIVTAFFLFSKYSSIFQIVQTWQGLASKIGTEIEAFFLFYEKECGMQPMEAREHGKKPKLINHGLALVFLYSSSCSYRDSSSPDTVRSIHSTFYKPLHKQFILIINFQQASFLSLGH